MIDMRGIMAVAFAGIGALLGLIIGIPIFGLVAVMGWPMFWAFTPCAILAVIGFIWGVILE